MENNIINNKYGKLTVIKFDSFEYYTYQKYVCKRKKWLCKCECGNIKAVLQNSLVANKTKSCGCLRKEAIEGKISKRRVKEAALKTIYSRYKWH